MGSRRSRGLRRPPRRLGLRILLVAVSVAITGVAVAAGMGVVPGLPESSTRTLLGAESDAPADDPAASLRMDSGDRSSRALRPDPTSTTPTGTPRASVSATSPSPSVVEVPQGGSGDLTVIAGNSGDPPDAGRIVTYRVELELGLPFDGAEVASFVAETLDDERGWRGVHDIAFTRTDGDAELRIIIASPDLTDTLCLPLDTGGELSCRVDDRVVLNGKRWAVGVPHFDGDLVAYRQYLVNHEVGHTLGYGHVECPGSGEPAPVMMQQTKGVGECRPNPWPTIAAS